MAGEPAWHPPCSLRPCDMTRTPRATASRWPGCRRAWRAAILSVVSARGESCHAGRQLPQERRSRGAAGPRDPRSISQPGVREAVQGRVHERARAEARDRKSTRLNSSHLVISYAVFCLKKKKKKHL